MYRLTSPNGIGNFDFDPYKNNGVSGFDVDFTLLPFSPYIKISPRFNPTGLYGGDYNDFRGLICGGDYSLPITTDQWETYQVNNKYYQQIFDRQIESMDYNNSWQLAGDIAGAAGGVAAGAAAGAVAGSIVPGIGTAVGAIVGAAGAAIGGTVDVIKNQALYAEQRDKLQDEFQFNLKTVQARPNTLTRTTAYNINNKYFPYVEYYTCTDKEVELLEKKLKYTGMTIGAIGSISEYLNPEDTTYIQAKLIRLEGLDEDWHLVNAIKQELIQGVYI